MIKSDPSPDDWWDDRLAAMEGLLGKSDEMVTHAVVPFRFGFQAGGRADVVHFRQHFEGVIYATCELIGLDKQIPNSIGNYELAICQPFGETWGIGIINSLAYYTLDVRLEPDQTMDIRPAVPGGSAISSLLFNDFGRFSVRGRPAGLLLCIGITSDELEACQKGNQSEVVRALKSKGVYPLTDLKRHSVFV